MYIIITIHNIYNIILLLLLDSNCSYNNNFISTSHSQ